MLSYYNNALAIVLFTPLIVLNGELPAIMNMISDGSLDFWTLMVIAGLFGFAIGYVTGLQIQVCIIIILFREFSFFRKETYTYFSLSLGSHHTHMV